MPVEKRISVASCSETLLAKVTLSTAKASPISEKVRTARSKGVSLATPAKPPVKNGSGVPVNVILPIGVIPAKRLMVVTAGTVFSLRRE
jgi:hypothetical protein